MPDSQTSSQLPPHMPSPQQQSWGAFISIIVIVLMIIVGAYYAWSERMKAYEVPAALSE